MSLRAFLDKVEHHFEKGGKYEKWYSLYEAADTILYRPRSVTKTTAHVRDGVDLKRIMITVWLCAFPAMFFGMWNVGYQANQVFADNPDLLAAQEGWRMALTAMLAGFDPGSIWGQYDPRGNLVCSHLSGDLHCRWILGSVICFDSPP